MKRPIARYWKTRLTDLKEALEANNFEAFVADNAAKAAQIVQEEILPKTGAKSVSWGGSMTFTASGLYDALKARKDLEAKFKPEFYVVRGGYVKRKPQHHFK